MFAIRKFSFYVGNRRIRLWNWVWLCIETGFWHCASMHDGKHMVSLNSVSYSFRIHESCYELSWIFSVELIELHPRNFTSDYERWIRISTTVRYISVSFVNTPVNNSWTISETYLGIFFWIDWVTTLEFHKWLRTINPCMYLKYGTFETFL